MVGRGGEFRIIVLTPRASKRQNPEYPTRRQGFQYHLEAVPDGMRKGLTSANFAVQYGDAAGRLLLRDSEGRNQDQCREDYYVSPQRGQ